VHETEPTSHWRTIHDLEFGDRLRLVVLIRHRAGRFSSNNRQFHMLDLYTNKEEIDLAHYDIFEVISEDLSETRAFTSQRED
jgi:hypothetical protein